MINGVSEKQYEMIAARLGALSSIDLSAPFMRRFWIMQLRVIQNQIEQRDHGSLQYPPDSEVVAWAEALLRERA